jgi:hypothetical protein
MTAAHTLMRRGYWRTLARQLRDKVAIGENAFLYADEIVTIIDVEADVDADIETCQKVMLARNGRGDALILDTISSAVLLMQSDGEKRVLANDLKAFIEGLRALPVEAPPIQSAPSGLELGEVIDESLDFPRTRRGILSD